MKALTLLVFVAATLAVVVPAQAQQATPPADPKAKPPQTELDELRDLMNCECECDCCARIKQHIKRRLKDPDARPMLAPEKKKTLKHRSRGRRFRARSSYGIDWSRPRPPTGNRWLDAAHAHKLRKARAVQRKAMKLLTEEQRERMRDLRYQRQKERIDLEASLKKQQIELKRLMRDKKATEEAVRRLVDAIAKIRADIQFLELKGRLDKRSLLSDEQREKLRRHR